MKGGIQILTTTTIPEHWLCWLWVMGYPKYLEGTWLGKVKLVFFEYYLHEYFSNIKHTIWRTFPESPFVELTQAHFDNLSPSPSDLAVKVLMIKFPSTPTVSVFACLLSYLKQ